jgi:uncharacterized integral membrane protein
MPPGRTHRPPGYRMREGRIGTATQLRIVIWTIVGTILVVVCASNRAYVTVDFLVIKPKLPLFLWLVIALAIGAAAGIVGTRVRRRRKG